MKLFFLPMIAAFALPTLCFPAQEESRFSPISLPSNSGPEPRNFFFSLPQSLRFEGMSPTDFQTSWSFFQPVPDRTPCPEDDGFAVNAKEIIATSIAPNDYEVNILVRVYWRSPSPGSKPRFYRDAGTQRDFDRKAEAAWSGVFRHRHFFKTVATYKVKTRIVSTYGDAGAPYPDKSSTVVLQMNTYGGACAFAIRDRGACKYGSIILHENSTACDYIHEIGHALGCVDRYQSGYPDPGWEANVMANPVKPPDYRNIEEILQNTVLHDPTAPSEPPMPPLFTRNDTPVLTRKFEAPGFQASVPTRRNLR